MACVVRPSVNICTNRFLSQTNGWIATKLAHDGLQVCLHPGCAEGQGRGQRSRDRGIIVISQKSLLLAGKWWITTKFAHDGPPVGLH